MSEDMDQFFTIPARTVELPEVSGCGVVHHDFSAGLSFSSMFDNDGRLLSKWMKKDGGKWTQVVTSEGLLNNRVAPRG